jgi:hypothetical protein
MPAEARDRYPLCDPDLLKAVGSSPKESWELVLLFASAQPATIRLAFASPRQLANRILYQLQGNRPTLA